MEIADMCWCNSGFILALLFSIHLCTSETKIVDNLCDELEKEELDKEERFKTKTYITCIMSTNALEIRPIGEECENIESDWKIVSSGGLNRRDILSIERCPSGTWIEVKTDEGNRWIKGTISHNKQCREASGTERLLAYKTQCILVTAKKYNWEMSVKVCLKLGSEHWTLLQNIDGEHQTFIEEFLYENFWDDEAWIGLRSRMRKLEWLSGNPVDDFIGYIPHNSEPAPTPTGPCYATAGARPDRAGGGWRGRPCDTKLRTICEQVTTADSQYISFTPSTTIRRPIPRMTTTETLTTSSKKPTISVTAEAVTRANNITLSTGNVDDDCNVQWLYIVVIGSFFVNVIIVITAVIVVKKRKRQPNEGAQQNSVMYSTIDDSSIVTPNSPSYTYIHAR